MRHLLTRYHRLLLVLVLSVTLAAGIGFGVSAIKPHTAHAEGGFFIPSTGTVFQDFLDNCKKCSHETWYTSYYDQHNTLQPAIVGGAHSGIDISSSQTDCTPATATSPATGIPVYAAAVGTVVWANFDTSNNGRAFGWSVVVRHGFGVGGNGHYTYTLYGHMGSDGLSPATDPKKGSVSCLQVQVGQQVTPATIIGYQGSSGLTKPATHVHFTIFGGSTDYTTLSTPYVPNAYPASPDFYTCIPLTAGDATTAQQVRAGDNMCTPSPTCTTQAGKTYFDDFSSYTPNQPPPQPPPSGYLLRGASGAAPTVQDVGGTGPAYRLLSFPYVGGQYWDSWALESALMLCSNYTVTVKLNFQTSGDRGGVTIAWNDATWNRIDIQPNVFFQNIEFRISYTGSTPSNPVVTGPALPRYSLPFNVGTDYWLRVVATSAGPGQGQVIVYWSTDGTNFTPEVTATGLANLEGYVGVGTAGPNLPNVYFDDLSAQEN